VRRNYNKFKMKLAIKIFLLGFSQAIHTLKDDQ
jgi:hypothetical protein